MAVAIPLCARAHWDIHHQRGSIFLRFSVFGKFQNHFIKRHSWPLGNHAAQSSRRSCQPAMETAQTNGVRSGVCSASLWIKTCLYLTPFSNHKQIYPMLLTKTSSIFLVFGLLRIIIISMMLSDYFPSQSCSKKRKKYFLLASLTWK